MFIREDIGDLGEVHADRLEGFQEFFYKDLSEYDVIVGWRADDSYFRYAQDFLNGVIYRSTLGEAIRLGNLGIQYFIQSKKAFAEINRISEPVEVEEYYRNKYVNRDRIARNARWQEYDMDKTGHFFEECSDVVLDNYDIHINIERFLEFYHKSDMRNLIDIHHPFLSTRSNLQQKQMLRLYTEYTIHTVRQQSMSGHQI